MLKAVAFLVALTILSLNESAKAQADGDLRLVDGITNTSGRVEIYYNGGWGTICDDDFHTREARVVCNQLGFGDTRPQAWRDAPYGNRTILLDDISCIGNETRLIECLHKPWGVHNCEHREDIGVECDGQSYADDLRLVGRSERSGHLEVRYAGRWGPVCSHRFNRYDAQVACRTLGFEANAAQVTYTYESVYAPMVLTNVYCHGNETSLSKCWFNGPFDTHCPGRSIGLNCLDITESTVGEIEVRLNGGSDVSGRLELSISGIWGTVCDDGFGNTSAQIACRMLNLPAEHAVAYSYTITGRRIAPLEIWLDDVQCNGTEETLMDCPHRNWTQHDCRHDEDVGIFCTDDAHAGDHYGIRLAGSNRTDRGRVEVEYYGIWGTVCKDYWRQANTEVICKSLNLPYGHATQTSLADYGPGTGPIWLDDVYCVGDEHSLFECRRAEIGEEDCAHVEDVAVICE